MICALSGGVDSTVAATLVHKVLGDRLHCVFVDNGLLRYKEAERVMDTFQKHLHLPVTKIDGAVRLLKQLKVSPSKTLTTNTSTNISLSQVVPMIMSCNTSQSSMSNHDCKQ